VERFAPDIWRWTARHPEWHPGTWGAEVACFALRDGARTVLVDPLVLDNEGWAELDGVVSGKVTILITIPYHVRSAEAAAARYRAQVWGHTACTRRMRSSSAFRELQPGGGPKGIRAFRIGSPRRQEMPLLIEGCSALAFGDAIVGVPGREGPLRVWTSTTDSNERWYRDRLVPSFAEVAEAAPERVLVTHGSSVATGGARELQRALERAGWSRPPA
jgi:hypothetical protein